MDAMIRPAEFGWRAFARYNLASDGHDLFLAYREHDRSIWTARLTLEKNETHAMGEPTLEESSGWSLDTGKGHDTRGFLQCIVDAAWEIGIKPRRLSESQGELAAIRYHLEDMRTLAKVKK